MGERQEQARTEKAARQQSKFYRFSQEGRARSLPQ